MELQNIGTEEIIVPQYHRKIKPWVLEQIKRSMEDHSYNIAYPITLDGQNTLVDGRHRLEAAKELGIVSVPWIKKPDGVSPIRFGLQCNADGQLCSPNDVFDLAERCYGLSQDGWSGDQIAKELRWDHDRVSKYKQIRQQLHPHVWATARSTKNDGFVELGVENVVERVSTIVDWRESHFRSLLKHLPYKDGDRAEFHAGYDYQLGIDVVLRPQGQGESTMQEKFLFTEFDTVTVEHCQDWLDLEPGDWYRLKAQYYFVGYDAKGNFRFDPWILLDWPRLQRATAQGRVPWRLRSNLKDAARASFMYVKFEKLPPEVIVACSNRAYSLF